MRRSSSTIPFGYKLDEEDTALLEPIEDQLEALKKILPMIHDQTISLREGSLYLESITGRKVSHMGLKKIAARHAR
tara:strand:+ start:507 stop:734 length:228 start_codon:yes stop_codon:yes gene_type:complete